MGLSFPVAPCRMFPRTGPQEKLGARKDREVSHRRLHKMKPPSPRSSKAQARKSMLIRRSCFASESFLAADSACESATATTCPSMNWKNLPGNSSQVTASPFFKPNSSSDIRGSRGLSSGARSFTRTRPFPFTELLTFNSVSISMTAGLASSLHCNRSVLSILVRPLP